MPDIFAEVAADWRAAEDRMRHLMHHGAPQPADAPVTQNENTNREEPPMSLITDVEQGYQAVKDELGKFEQALPGLIEQGRKLEANPLAQVAIQAGEHFAAGILPPEALEVIASIAGKVLDGLLALYNPQAPGAPSAPGAVAPAQ